MARARLERRAEAIRTRQSEERRRLGEERIRIAREVHDLLAHNVSIINVQAATALHLLDQNGPSNGQPDSARVALSTIKQTSKDTMRELRSVLGVLRQVDEALPRAPAPGLERLDELVFRLRSAGLLVEASIEGAARPVPSAIDQAAYRIVQEALTNVTRHADIDTATVRVRYRDSELELQIDDDGCSPPDECAPVGSGIVGMQQRAATLGGDLEAGPRSDGGFRVLAHLPLDAAS